MIRCILAICGLIAADQAVKWYTVSHLTLGETAPLLPGLVELLRVHNYGAAWSSFSGMRWLHDIGKSGLWYLLILVPLVGPVILLIWFCRLGDYGENAYGPDPKVAEMA